MLLYLDVVVSVGVLLAARTRAHMVMNTPKPFLFDQGDEAGTNRNPLSAFTNPFPCQGKFGASEVTTISAGGYQLVNFTGSTQHSGGSCQFSISYDDPQVVDAHNYKVIYTIIGGCPLQSTDGKDVGGMESFGRPDGLHCGNDHDLNCIRLFNVPIPKELKNGKATFTWTWFNNVGNKEMYMNCAPVEIIGGSDNLDYINALPHVFVANIANQTIPGDGIVNIPTPGIHGLILETPAALPALWGDCSLPTALPTF
ncbi:hypothetical protein GQ53DRAFT_663542, partial [Thozetella sp. PMI_491]